MDNFIEYINISKTYKDNSIIDNFNLKIKQGEFVTIIGSSGSGKTTILKMVNGLIKPNSGTITINNEDISSKDIIELRRSIGYSIQGSILFPHLTVFQNVSYVLKLLKLDKVLIEEKVNYWLEVVGLDSSYNNRYASELSGGQQQRVGIARALAASPNIILMDEPFGAVDGITRLQLQEMIKEIHKKTKVTILFVTHDIKEALNLGTKVLIMSNGKIEQYAEPSEVKSNPKTEFVNMLINN